MFVSNSCGCGADLEKTKREYLEFAGADALDDALAKTCEQTLKKLELLRPFEERVANSPAPQCASA